MIKLNSYRHPVILSFFLPIFLVGCGIETEQFIQGYWYRGDVHFMDQWYFDRGSYDHQMGVFDGNTIRSTGGYQVIDYDEDTLTLELVEIGSSFNDERSQIIITVNRDSDTIRIRGKTYERVLP
jgi:hypothetical protein